LFSNKRNAGGKLMIENMVETDIINTNTVYLSIPEQDYFFSYDSVTIDAAEEITRNYFLMRGREGRPTVKDISFDEPLHRVKITLEVEQDYETDKKGYAVPTHLDITRNNEVNNEVE
jgi:hypothetical protein